MRNNGFPSFAKEGTPFFLKPCGEQQPDAAGWRNVAATRLKPFIHAFLAGKIFLRRGGECAEQAVMFAVGSGGEEQRVVRTRVGCAGSETNRPQSVNTQD